MKRPNKRPKIIDNSAIVNDFLISCTSCTEAESQRLTKPKLRFSCTETCTVPALARPAPTAAGRRQKVPPRQCFHSVEFLFHAVETSGKCRFCPTPPLAQRMRSAGFSAGNFRFWLCKSLTVSVSAGSAGFFSYRQGYNRNRGRTTYVCTPDSIYSQEG